MKVLVNDGIEEIGKKLMEEAGIDVDMNTITQDDLSTRLNEYDGICVRSATKVRQNLIDNAPQLESNWKRSVGLDNIDVDYAHSKGIKVVNTHTAASPLCRRVGNSTFNVNSSRNLHMSNRAMSLRGSADFAKLKKAYSNGTELEGKTIGLIGWDVLDKN